MEVCVLVLSLLYQYHPPNRLKPPNDPGMGGSTPGTSSGGVTPQPQGLSGSGGGTPTGGLCASTSSQSQAQAQAQAAAAAAASKKRRWYLGIQSKKDPAHVMTEVYKALLQVGGWVCGFCVYVCGRTVDAIPKKTITSISASHTFPTTTPTQLRCEWTAVSSYRLKVRWAARGP